MKAGFDLISRFADTIGATPGSQLGLTREQVLAHGAQFYDEGYVR